MLSDEKIEAALYAQCPDFDEWHEGPSTDDIRAVARAIESAATAPLLERIKEMEESERSSERARVKLCSIHQYQKEALIARIAALEQQLEAALKDAERYRWLRNTPLANNVTLASYFGGSRMQDFDAAIDAARAAIKEQT